MNKKILRLIAVALLYVTGVFAGEVWVSPDGSDKNDGSRKYPKQTLNAALRQAREWRRWGGESVKEGIYIMLEGGTYILSEPLFIRPEDSGTVGAPTVIKGVDGQSAVISGGLTLSNWKRCAEADGISSAVCNSLWVSDVPLFNGNIVDFRQLWVNGKKAVRARNVSDFKQMDQILSNDVERQILWVPAKSVQEICYSSNAELVLHQMWEVSVLRIRSIETDGDSAAIKFHSPESRIQFERPWPRPMIAEGRNSAFYLVGALELLDNPGEWHYDRRTSKLYYYPLPGEDMSAASAVIPVLETIVKVEGTPDRPVSHIRFENVQFHHATWMRPSVKGHVPLQAGMYLLDAYRINPKQERDHGNHPLDNQAWIGCPPAAVKVEGARDVVFHNCSFERMGAAGIDFRKSQYTRVVGCLFRDIAGNGMQIGAFSAPSFETHLPYNPADEREICSGQEIADNYVTDIGNEEWGSVGILAGYVRDILIRNNEISHIPYTGISMGWGWTRSKSCMRNNRIIANNIHHYAEHMHDVSGIYTLSAQPNSLIAENYVHDIVLSPYAHDPDHWFFLYLDESSSYIEVRDNWCDAEKFLQNANGPGNVWKNNGPIVNDSIRRKAGLESQYNYLLNK